MTRRIVIWGVLLVVLAACRGETEQQGESKEAPVPTPEPVVTEAAAVPDSAPVPDTPPVEEISVQVAEPAVPERDLALAFGLPSIAAMNLHSSREMIVEAVYQASTLSGSGQLGQVTSTGTLQLTPSGLQYLAESTDRLVLEIGGPTQEFVLKNVQGFTQAATSSEWLLQPHVLQYTHTMEGVGSAEIAVQFDGRNFKTEARGWSTYENKRYDLELTASGHSTGERDYHGQDVRTEFELTGTITRDGFTIEVSEHHASSTVSATNLRLRYSQRGSASRFSGTLNNVLRSEGVEYKLNNVQVQFDSSERGGEGAAGFTLFQGNVLRDGAPFGQCVLEAGRAYLQVGSDRVRLDMSIAEPAAGQ